MVVGDSRLSKTSKKVVGFLAFCFHQQYNHGQQIFVSPWEALWLASELRKLLGTKGIERLQEVVHARKDGLK